MNRFEVLENLKVRDYFCKNKDEEGGPTYTPRENRKNTYNTIAKKLTKYFDVNSNISITDVGGGTGYLGSIIPKAWDFTNITIRRSEVEHCKQNGINVVEANILDLPMKEGTFDCALSILTLPYITDQVHGLFETCRILKDGGILVNGINLVPENNPIEYFNILNRQNLNRFFNSFGMSILEEFILLDDTNTEILISIVRKKGTML